MSLSRRKTAVCSIASVTADRNNSVTKKGVYPMPRIDDTLGRVCDANYFSFMDLKSGYWQIKSMERIERIKAAFITRQIYLAYLYDVVDSAFNFGDHLKRLRIVLEAVVRANPKARKMPLRLRGVAVSWPHHRQ